MVHMKECVELRHGFRGWLMREPMNNISEDIGNKELVSLVCYS